MKKLSHIKVFESFDLPATDHPSPTAPSNVATEKFDPAKEELYSFKNEHNSVVVDAEFSKDSFLHKFKPGVSFEKGWQSLVDHEDSIMSFFQKLIGNISTRFWGFIGINSMPELDADGQPEAGYEITTMVP